MKILGHIHTFNDEEVIEQSLRAVLRQSHAVDEILIVDNHSVDGTLEREFPEQVTLIRHPENLGTSGAVVTGFQYALDNGYDWIWILDADSAPRPDALEKLVELYHSFSVEVQSAVCALGCLAVDVTTQVPHHGMSFTAQGFCPVNPRAEQSFYTCDATIWSGALFKMQSVREIGLPSADYVLDWGENEYGYRAKQSGYQIFIHQGSRLDHNIGAPGGPHGPRENSYQLGPFRFRLPDLPPIRLYYIYRNMTYFFLYEYFHGNIFRFIQASAWMPRHLLKLVLAGKFKPDLVTCLRGGWDGLWKRMERRY